MATLSTPLMTWEVFERLPDGDGRHRELIEGELQTLPPAKLRHSRVAKRVFRELLVLEDRGLGEALFEAGYKLTENPDTWVQPDASFVLAARARAVDEDGYHRRAPDLAVEVVSPSETALDLQKKVELLLDAGGQLVWVFYPTTRKVQVHLPDGTSFTRGERDMLSAPQFAADWEFPVARVFED